MPSKKKKYNARFPPARIKKIMQSDEEVGKVAQAVPVIISRALELFVQSLLTKAESVTTARNAKTLTPSHLKACILAESRFDFLKDLVATVPDVQGEEEMAVATPSTSTPLNSSSSPFVFPPQSQQMQGMTSTTTTTTAPQLVPPQPPLLPPPHPSASNYPVPVGSETTTSTTSIPTVPDELPAYAVGLDIPPRPNHFIGNAAGVTGNPYVPSYSNNGGATSDH